MAVSHTAVRSPSPANLLALKQCREETLPALPYRKMVCPMKLLKICLLLVGSWTLVGCGSNTPTKLVTELTAEEEAAIQAEMEAVEMDEAAQRRPAKKSR